MPEITLRTFHDRCRRSARTRLRGSFFCRNVGLVVTRSCDELREPQISVCDDNFAIMSGPQTGTTVTPVFNAMGFFYTLEPVGSLRAFSLF